MALKTLWSALTGKMTLSGTKDFCRSQPDTYAVRIAEISPALLYLPNSPDANSPICNPRSFRVSCLSFNPTLFRTRTSTGMATDHPLNCPEQLEDHHDWECSTCAEDFHTSTSPPWYTDDKFLVCSECIRSRFQAAVDSGVDWPARWGGIALDVEHYRHILDDELYNAYIAKSQEKAQEPEPSAHEIPEGLTLGVDIQRCPGCKKLIGLIDGCNHIVCELCMKNFCFICGEEAFDDGSNHWAPGGCPRYGLRDSARAIYDNVVDDQETSGEEEEEEEEEVLPPWLIVGGDGAAMPTRGITSFNMAMQTSTPETQNVLRRFVDRSRPVLAEEDFRIALRAMGTNHPLSGIPDHDWYSALFVAARRVQHRRFLIILLIIAFESEDLPDQPPPPEPS